MRVNTLIVFSATFLLLFASCKTVKLVGVQSSSSIKVPVDASVQSLADTSFINYLQPYKNHVDGQMNRVIGTSAQLMKAHKPESLLSNFSADVYRQAASDFLGNQVDLAIVNMGGLRTEVPQGNITVRKVFELMPFENELVILWLTGSQLVELLDGFAVVGGQGVSGIQMTIANKKAVEVLVNGKPLEMEKLYSVATNDYLAGGNDGMNVLAKATKRRDTSLKIRNVLLNYIQKQTASGKSIEAKLDGRIRIAN